MEKELYFALISTLIYLIWAIPLWKDILRGRTIPHLFTHGLWWILVGFNVYVLYENKEYYTFVPSLLMFFSLSFCVVFGFKYYKNVQINWFDYLCLFLWVLLILYWIVSKNVLWTVIMTLVIDLIAFLPTFKKWWIAPWTETIFIYLMSAVWQIATLLSLQVFENWENTLFWWYLVVANTFFFCMVAYRRYSLKGFKSLFE